MLSEDSISRINLYPVFAIRKLLLWRLDSNSAQFKKVLGMSKSQLIDEIMAADLTEVDAGRLFKEYRYLTTPSLKIYLLPPELRTIITPRELQERLTEYLSNLLRQGDDEISYITPQIVDYEEFADIIEFRFVYKDKISYLDINEEPAEVIQTLYGFVWFEFTLNYVVITSTNNRVIDKLVAAIYFSLGVIPRAVQFSKQIANSISSSQDAKRYSHQEPLTGIRYTISGEPEKMTQKLPEIQQRDGSCQQTGSLFRESVLDQVVACIGINSKQGRIYLTKILPSPLLRQWAVERLPPIISDLREFFRTQPLAQLKGVVERLNQTEEEKNIILDLATSMINLASGTDNLCPTNISADTLLRLLKKKFFQVYLYLLCDQCEEGGETCPNPACGEQGQSYRNDNFFCSHCKQDLSVNDTVTLRCINDHEMTGSLEEALMLIPTPHFVSIISKCFEAAGFVWRNDWQISIYQGYIFLGTPESQPGTTIYGDVAKLVQIGKVSGNVVVERN